MDAQPRVHPFAVSPQLVPALGGVLACVSQNRRALLHALLKLDRKAEKRRGRQVERRQTRMRESDVDCALRLSAVPPLACSDSMNQAANQLARARRIVKAQKNIACDREVVSAQNEPLNVSVVQLTHCGRQS